MEELLEFIRPESVLLLPPLTQTHMANQTIPDNVTNSAPVPQVTEKQVIKLPSTELPKGDKLLEPSPQTTNTASDPSSSHQKDRIVSPEQEFEILLDQLARNKSEILLLRNELAKRDSQTTDKDRLLQELQATNNEVLELRKQLDDERELNTKLSAENTLYKSKLGNAPLTVLEEQLAHCRKVLKELQNLKVKWTSDIQKSDRMRACLKDIVGRGPINELEREELKSSIKKLNSMIAQLSEQQRSAEHPQLTGLANWPSEQKIKDAYN